MPVVPSFDYPFAFVGNDCAIVEQDSADDVRNAVAVLLLTEEGSREVLPSYGTPAYLFGQTPIAANPGLEAAVIKWEPRAKVTFSETPDALGILIRDVMAEVRGGR